MPKYTDPWGYSKLATYMECPQKFKFQYMDKLSQPSSSAMVRGGEIHSACEAYLNGWDKILDPRLENWEEQFDVLKTKNFKTEQAWGFDKAWNRLPDWFHKDTWLRAKADCVYLEDDGRKLVVIDFKTGKYKVPPEMQIELYAIAGLSVYPDVEVVGAEYWFLDSGNVLSRDYTKAHLLELRAKYADLELYRDEAFAPLPSRACAFCPYSRSKDGPCSAG